MTTCEHGVPDDDLCLACNRTGENKPAQRERRGVEICPDCGDPITYPHPGCGDREHGP